MRYVTRPFTIEARTRLKGVRREGSPFNAPWSQTLDLLERELSHLGVRSDFVMQIDVTEDDLKLNGELRANARPASPAVAISVERPKKPPLLFVCGKFPSWQHNVRAIALGLEALRKVERYGIVQAEEQYTGFGALPPGMAMPAAKMTVDEAALFIATHGEFGAKGNESRVARELVEQPEALRQYYRHASKVLHPDAGGDPAEFRKLTEAYELLRAS